LRKGQLPHRGKSLYWHKVIGEAFVKEIAHILASDLFGGNDAGMPAAAPSARC
jgi:hypothetical protein